jgi:hypothetical protein
LVTVLRSLDRSLNPPITHHLRQRPPGKRGLGGLIFLLRTGIYWTATLVFNNGIYPPPLTWISEHRSLSWPRWLVTPQPCQNHLLLYMDVYSSGLSDCLSNLLQTFHDSCSSLTFSMSPDYTIHNGYVWKDYGSNKWILTLNGASAGALQSTIPVFITLVGPMTWIVIKYTCYRLSFSRRRRRPYYPFYYRQKQVLLRNSSGDLSTFIDAFSLFWIRREGNMWLHLWRTFPLVLVCLAFSLSWQVAGIVSFYI